MEKCMDLSPPCLTCITYCHDYTPSKPMLHWPTAPHAPHTFLPQQLCISYSLDLQCLFLTPSPALYTPIVIISSNASPLTRAHLCVQLYLGRNDTYIGPFILPTCWLCLEHQGLPAYTYVSPAFYTGPGTCSLPGKFTVLVLYFDGW